jgi:hypothetical protein
MLRTSRARNSFSSTDSIAFTTVRLVARRCASARPPAFAYSPGIGDTLRRLATALPLLPARLRKRPERFGVDPAIGPKAAEHART